MSSMGGDAPIKRLPVHESIVRFTRQTAKGPEPKFLALLIKDIRVMMLHEAIIKAIRRTDDKDELSYLAMFIKGTEIWEGHVEIIGAWDEQVQGVQRSSGADIVWFGYLGVPAELLEQKEEAEKKVRESAGVESW